MILIHLKREGTPGLAKRVFNRFLRDGYEEAGVRWHREMRERHFSKAGATMYRYAPRQGDPGRPGRYGFMRTYQGRKLKRHGHTRPLEKTGKSRRMTRSAAIRATSKGVRVSFEAGNLARYNRINMRAEMEAVTVREQADLAKTIDKIIDLRIKRFRVTQTETVS